MSVLSRSRSMSSKNTSSNQGRLATLAELSQSMPTDSGISRDFEPCAATASMFLYAQGNSVVCSHHDTLTIERRFSRHTEEIQLLAVDTVSERGTGRQVVSYDAGQTAIVWDCMTGDEIARFASYENLTVAAWMRNGNVAFGNAQGNVILFEPTTSEHISARTIDQIPITALAPAADCRTYAIGFSNGSLLIAALQPRFTILHNLTTSRGPSPIVTLAWHASSSRQKSDMLAAQTNDGDLRVWSIAKSPTSSDTAKVVRVLKRRDNYQTGPNWLGWSKNGRIIQYCEGDTLTDTQPYRETSSWDVRTKHVTYDAVPTLGQVRGLAVYGQGATLFTLGRSNTVQQFDLNSPPQLVANVQHPANLLPPSPPVSIEEQKSQNVSAPAANVEYSTVPINLDISESDEEHMSPLARIARDRAGMEHDRMTPDILSDRTDTLSPVSSRSQASTNSRSSADSRDRMYRPHRKHSSVVSRGMSEGTTMSFGSSLHSTQEPSLASIRDSISMSSLSSASNAHSHRSRPRGSRLRQEVLRSPDDGKVVDIFKFTKTRLSDIPYRHPQALDNSHLTNDDLRRQMLSTIFGWDGEAEALVRDEMNRHPAGSATRLLLAKWVGDLDTDIMATGSESMTSSDWMLLALSGIGGQVSQTKVARAYVQRLLEKGDVHTAATIMIGMGDQNDAIEIYVSHKRYMEALILTALVFPADWQRQAELVRKWGEWAVQHSQQQLAIRCFSCTGSESSEPWSSPSAQTLTFQTLHNRGIPEMLSPPLSPPGARGPQRSIAKTSALKLITSFGDKAAKSKFFGLGDNDRTPINGPGGGTVTPIAESALSPGGDTAHTAFLRPSHRSTYNTPISARTATPGGFTRQRLPSIGETPADSQQNVLPRWRLETSKASTSAASNLAKDSNNPRARAHERNSSQPESLQLSSATYTPPIGRAATVSPMIEKNKELAALSLPSPSPDSFSLLKQSARTRNGSRGRKPDGLQIQWPPMESIITGDYMASPDPSTSSSKYRSGRSVAGSVTSRSTAASHARSPLVSERSFRSGSDHQSPVVSGRSIDQYISSLDAAQHLAEKLRSRDRQGQDKSSKVRSSSRKSKGRDTSEDRGRSGARYIKPAKRSPRSPVPMSPEDLRGLGVVGYGDETSSVAGSLAESRTSKLSKTSQPKARSSKPTSRVRHTSPEATPVTRRTNPGSLPTSRTTSRNQSRQRSPSSRLTLVDARGRSQGRSGSVVRSPSSPLPMSPQAKFYQADDDDAADLKRAKEEQRLFRSRQRSVSRLRERGTSTRRATSPDKRRERSSSRKRGERDRSQGRREHSQSQPHEVTHARSVSDLNAASQVRDARTIKKEAAARELEERRKSLARRPSAPPIVHPEDIAQLSPMTYQSMIPPDYPRSAGSPSPRIPQQVGIQTNSLVMPKEQPKDPNSSAPQIGLPATPRAMRHPKYDPEGKDIPDVPQIPERYDSSLPPTWGGPVNTLSYNNAFENLAPLPKTIYGGAQYSPRRMPPRSASAPVPENAILSNWPHPLPANLPLHPAFQSGLPPSNRRRTQDTTSSSLSARKINPSSSSQPEMLGYESQNSRPSYASGLPSIMTGIDETLEAGSQAINPSNDNLTPPPPPPPPHPPILKELQHLATPPPPPPAPLYRPNNTNSVISGVSSQGSGVIEIVMDDDQEKTNATRSPEVLDVNQQIPLSRPINHNRGRSETDNSLSGRLSRAADRIRNRSGSRGPNATSPVLDRTKSPIERTSPYESVSNPWSPPIRSSTNTPAMPSSNLTERHPREVKASLVEYDGGMI